jgi:hypothetical protein
MCIAVVKAVAERDHGARIVSRDHRAQLRKRRGGIERRQQHAALREAGTFFQMQVRDNEKALVFPEQRAGQIGNKDNACDGDGWNSICRLRGSHLASILIGRHRLLHEFLGGLRQQLVRCFAINRFAADFQHHRHRQRRNPVEFLVGDSALDPN